MTQKSKIYIAVIAVSLLITAGSAALRYHENAAVKAMPAVAPPRQNADNAAAAQDAYIMPDRIMPAKPLAAAQGGDTAPAAPEPREESFEQKPGGYGEHPSLLAFNREMAQAMGALNPEDFLTGDFREKYFNNPQIQKILLKYSKDPAFMRLLGQMAADKEFMSETARVLTPPVKEKK